MNYNFSEDLKSIREILGLSQSEFASQLGVERVTVSRNELGKTKPSSNFLESVYSYAFDKKIKINKLKEMLWRDDLGTNAKLLFHGAKSEINGEIDVHYGRQNNDFGQGFYTGETYEQAISFVSGFDHSSVYYLNFDDKNLKCKRYEVNQEWMMTIAYYRGTLEEYKTHPKIKAPLPCDIKELGVDGVNKIWRDARLKGAGIKRATTLVTAAEHSIGNTEAPRSARKEIRNLLNDYEIYKNRMDELMEEIEKTLSPNKVSPPAHIFIKHVPKRFLEKDFFISSGVFSISII